ncbi:MAG: glycosyltransferase [Thermodesulfobacteriota bacterium]
MSVVVLTHDRPAELGRTLEHLTALPEAPDVVVVDNDSRGAAVHEVVALFPGVDLVSLAANVGAAGRNAGVLRARTPYVAFCDDDTWWRPGSLVLGADLLDRHPHLAVVSGRVLVGPDERDDPACVEMAASPLRDRGGPGRATLGYLAGASIVRRSAFLEVGGYPRRYFLGGEEALVAIDLAAAGWELAYVTELVVHHHPSSLRDRRLRRRLLARNALWTAWLRRPAVRALRVTARAAVGAVREPVLGLALLEAIAGLPWVLRSRRVVPRRVEADLRLIEARRAPGATAN